MHFMKKTFFTILSLFLVVGLMPQVYSKPLNKSVSRQKVKEAQDKMMGRGDYDSSFAELMELKKSYPDMYEILIALGVAEYGRMNYTEARNLFQQGIKSGAKGKTKEMLKFMLERMKENKGILSVIEVDNDSRAMIGDRGREELIDKLNASHIVALNSQLEEGRYYIFTIIPHLLWLRDNFGEVENIHKILGEVYYSSYHYSDAAVNYLIELKKDPSNADICMKLADSYVGTGDFESARKYYDVMIKIYRDEQEGKNKALIRRIKSIKQSLPESYKDISELISAKKFIRAEQLAKQRINLNPGDYIAITQLGRIYWDKGEKKQAIKLFRKVARIAPDYPTAHLFLGKAYFFERKPEKGIKEFEVFKEKMELVPEMDEETTGIYVQNLHYICYMYYTQRRYAEAMSECNKILKLRPEDQRAHYNLAVCFYVYKHNRSKAYSRLQEIIEIDPDTAVADQARYYIDYIRRNPDSRVASDFSFLDAE